MAPSMLSDFIIALMAIALLRSASSIPQPWPSVSNLAKDFILRLLVLDPATRLTADQAIRHPWVVTMAASSSTTNLHRSISQNLRQRASRSSSRCPSSVASSGDSNSAGWVKQRKQGAGQGSWTDAASERHTNSGQRALGSSLLSS